MRTNGRLCRLPARMKSFRPSWTLLLRLLHLLLRPRLYPLLLPRQLHPCQSLGHPQISSELLPPVPRLDRKHRSRDLPNGHPFLAQRHRTLARAPARMQPAPRVRSDRCRQTLKSVTTCHLKHSLPTVSLWEVGRESPRATVTDSPQFAAILDTTRPRHLVHPTFSMSPIVQARLLATQLLGKTRSADGYHVLGLPSHLHLVRLVLVGNMNLFIISFLAHSIVYFVDLVVDTVMTLHVHILVICPASLDLVPA
jgi:hypothetical protein